MRVFVLFDRVASSFMVPFMSKSNGTAMRELQMSLRNADAENVLSQNANDFDLFVIGDYVQDEGRLVPFEPVKLGCVGDLVQVAH